MKRFISWLFSLTVAGLLFGALIIAGIFYYFGAGLPDYKTLEKYEPPVVSRLYSSDGRVFAEYAHEKRIYVPLESIPLHVRQAFLSAEDKNFYDHFGIDIPSIFAAALTNVKNIGTSRRPIGASTITQQVAKNFLLSQISHMVSLERKIKEAILSLRIENAYSKDYILELYLNEVFLGNRSYGLAAAALNYFNKSLSELTVSEAAFFAALPKAPSRYHPERNPKLTYARRNWVIDRMYEDGVITLEQAKEARAERLVLRKRNNKNAVQGTYFAEEVRREMIKKFGEESVYQDGYVVRTSLDPTLQKLAEDVLRKGLETYDRNHGWRGPIANIDLDKIPTGFDDPKDTRPLWQQRLNKILRPAGSGTWKMALVLDVEKDGVEIGLRDGKKGAISLAELKWARRFINDEARGSVIRHPKQALSAGDIILVDALIEDAPKDKKETSKEADAGAVQRLQKLHKGAPAYKLCQIPSVSGALVAMDPETGRVLAMQGGYRFGMSQFNRATQAKRQTGSAFKPFSYVAAFEQGLTPSTVLDDAPFAIDIGYGLGVWQPQNWDKKFKGPITVRRSFELSRNVAIIRAVHEQIGMKNVVDVAKRFDVDKDMPVQLAGILGASETTPLKLTAAYAMICNGGKKISPTFFDKIQDRRGRTVVQSNHALCEGCKVDDPRYLPLLTDLRSQVTDPVSAYQMTSLLRGAVERGLGKTMLSIPHQVTAKSGTTNDYRDAWMMGYSPTLVVGVYVGFDAPRTLGIRHYGTKVAGPIFKEFMTKALDGKPVVPFTLPKGVKMVKVNAYTGAKAYSGDPQAIYEAFSPGTEMTDYTNLPSWDSPYEMAGEDHHGGFPNGGYGYGSGNAYTHSSGPESPFGPSRRNTESRDEQRSQDASRAYRPAYPSRQAALEGGNTYGPSSAPRSEAESTPEPSKRLNPYSSQTAPSSVSGTGGVY